MGNVRISVKAARVNANMIQREAAEKIGISRVTLQNYESGKTIPTWEMAAKIAEVYNFPMENIFYGKKDD